LTKLGPRWSPDGEQQQANDKGDNGQQTADDKKRARNSIPLPRDWFGKKKPDEPVDEQTVDKKPDDKKQAQNSIPLPFDWFGKKKPPDGPADALVLRGDKLMLDTTHSDAKGSDELAGGLELYRRNELAEAQAVFHTCAENQKNAPAVAEESRFYEAECLRRQEKYPTACDTYHKMLMDFPSGAFRDQACQRMFDIANYWLEDTRKEMQLYEEKKEGKRWFVVTPIMHFETAKPFLDQEGRALEALERVRYNDLTGQLADRALFLAGTVKFWREDYADADQYFTQLAESYPNSKLAPRAVELGIIAKHMSTGGSDYDGRKVAEARKLINSAMQNYPTLAHEKQDFLTRQLVNCNLQQAEKDFKIAEFYRRTGHPGSAYFYYEIVRRRYPGSKYADEATEKMHELHAKAEKEQEQAPPVPVHPPRDMGPGPSGLPETMPAPRPMQGYPGMR
jgi:outer membrane protein assembly factor BamD (BamD/ComL family)